MLRLYMELSGDTLKAFCPFGTDACGTLPPDAKVELQEQHEHYYQWNVIRRVDVKDIVSARWTPNFSAYVEGELHAAGLTGMDFSANEFILLIDGNPTRYHETGGERGATFERLSVAEIKALGL